MSGTHPLAQRQRAHASLWSDDVDSTLSTKQKIVIGTIEIAIAKIVALMREEGARYDMGQAIAALDKMGAAIHNVRLAFAIGDINKAARPADE